jgi:hypothetical protein
MSVAPVGPSVATQAINVDARVERINGYLSAPWTDSERNYGKAYDTHAMPQAEVEQVARIYRDAGWEVEVSSDRDGRYIHFKPRPIPPTPRAF